ncbi:MAG TPA: hypothetical protein VFU15_13365 [Bacteroidia bacterium]|nr:hypothetical protein [Bacteroidia bacterium]
MKNIVKISLAGMMLSSLAFVGCKKGPDDPFMSLHTRKGRVVGDWTLKAGTETMSNGSSTTTYTWDGTNITVTQGSNSSTNGETVTVNFEKDGTYKMVTTDTYTTPFAYTDTQTSTGTWNFTGKIGDDKNKDHIVMRELSNTDVVAAGSSTTTTTSSYTGDSAPATVWYLDELKNKEMKITWNGTSTAGSSTDSDQGSMTFNQ